MVVTQVPNWRSPRAGNIAVAVLVLKGLQLGDVSVPSILEGMPNEPKRIETLPLRLSWNYCGLLSLLTHPSAEWGFSDHFGGTAQ